jgi:hypothetical protein
VGEVVHIEDYRPHLALVEGDNAYMVSIALLEDVVAERKPLSVLGSDVLRLIIDDYLELIHE